jgi:hypothetical protein
MLKSYDFAANVPKYYFPYVEINVRMTSRLVSSFSKLYPESNAEPIVVILGTKSWDFFSMQLLTPVLSISDSK